MRSRRIVLLNCDVKIRTLQTTKVSGTQAGFNRALSELWCRAEGLATRLTCGAPHGAAFAEDSGFRSSDPDVPLVFPPEELRRLIPMNEANRYFSPIKSSMRYNVCKISVAPLL